MTNYNVGEIVKDYKMVANYVNTVEERGSVEDVTKFQEVYKISLRLDNTMKQALLNGGAENTELITTSKDHEHLLTKMKTMAEKHNIAVPKSIDDLFAEMGITHPSQNNDKESNRRPGCINAAKH